MCVLNENRPTFNVGSLVCWRPLVAKIAKKSCVNILSFINISTFLIHQHIKPINLALHQNSKDLLVLPLCVLHRRLFWLNIFVTSLEQMVTHTIQEYGAQQIHVTPIIQSSWLAYLDNIAVSRKQCDYSLSHMICIRFCGNVNKRMLAHTHAPRACGRSVVQAPPQSASQGLCDTYSQIVLHHLPTHMNTHFPPGLCSLSTRLF